MSVFKSFATSFLEGMTKNVTERRAEAKEERKRKERIAETVGLKTYQKRQANYQKYLNIANKLSKLGGGSDETKQNIAKLVTNPELLLAADTFVTNFSRKYPNVKITPQRINGLIGNLDLVGADENMKLEEAAKKAAGLVVKNTNLDKEKEDPSDMETNMIFSLMGVDAHRREQAKLDELMVGDVSAGDLYRMSSGGEYVPIDSATGVLDTSYFPTPFDSRDEDLAKDTIKAATASGINAKIEQLERQQIETGDETYGDQASKLRLKLEKYNDNVFSVVEELDKEYGAVRLKDLIMEEGDLHNYARSKLLTKGVRGEALRLLLEDEDAVNRFGKTSILEAAKVAGITLEDKGEQPPKGGTDNNEGLPTIESLREKIKSGELGAGSYMVSNPPKGGNPVVASPEYVQKLRAGI